MAFHSGPGQFTFDEATGALLTTGGGGGGGDVNIVEILGNPVAIGNPLPVELSDGTNPVGTASNPLSVNVISGGGSNASVGATGSPVPASATFVGAKSPTNTLAGLNVDANGVLEVETLLAASSSVSLGFTNSNVIGDAVASPGTAINMTRGVVEFTCSNDLVGGSFTFQTGAVFELPLIARRIDSFETVTTFIPVAGESSLWLVECADFSQFQVTLASLITAGNVQVSVNVDNGVTSLAQAVGQPDGSLLHVTVDNPSSSGGQFNTTPPSLTNGQTSTLQVDSAGNLKVTEQSPSMMDLLQSILGELQSLRKIFSICAEESGQARASDFDPANGIAASEDVVTVSS